MSMSIEKTTLKNNEIAFKWFNSYAGIMVRTPSKTLVIDPVDVKAKGFSEIDAILITHEHYDHLEAPLVCKIQAETQCQVLADPTSKARLTNSLPTEKLQEMQAGTEIKIDDVTIRAEACNHELAATPVTYLITSEDDVRLFHTGDSMPFPEMAAIGKEYKPDIVFCTVGIAPGASPEAGVEIVNLIKPKVAAPYHAASRSELVAFCSLVKKTQSKVTCLLPEKGNVYIVGKERRK